MNLCKTCKRWTCGAQGANHKMAIPCANYIPPTNADRIRAMSDEELADYLRWHNDSYSRYGMDWLDWLKAPVEEGDNGN